MENINGILVFNKGDELPELPEGLRTDFKIVSLFGFKIVEIDGEKLWQAGTEEDYLESESKRLDLPLEEVKKRKRVSCYNTAPMQCAGMCGTGWCKLAYNPVASYYYCNCTG